MVPVLHHMVYIENRLANTGPLGPQYTQTQSVFEDKVSRQDRENDTGSKKASRKREDLQTRAEVLKALHLIQRYI